ncbi:MAG: aldehyde dehydrogenase [Sphingobium sp.]|nr:MAG: aldehyde dehydrogenase [Sphingobium sp.]
MSGDNEVGIRLRAVRQREGLSQRALAKRAGVPSSTVSLIESGHTNPSVGSLKRLLDCIGMSLGDFFNLDLKAESQVFFRADELVEISRGKVNYRQVGLPGASSIQILHEVYQPGSDSGRVMLTHDGDEGGIVITGRLEVTVGDQVRVLKAGDAYLFSSRVPHRFRNVGDDICVSISACTPPTF